MTIWYASDIEAWIDPDDKSFRVGMTPEGPVEEYKLEFETQEDFYKWYNSEE